MTVGTLDRPFDRLVRSAETLHDYTVTVQHGASEPPGGVAEAVPYISFDEMVDRMTAADIVVTQAGVGSIVLAIQLGHTPVVMPRLRRFGEHVDDHQTQIAERLADHGLVIPIGDGAELEAAVLRVPIQRQVRQPSRTALHAAVRGALSA